MTLFFLICHRGKGRRESVPPTHLGGLPTQLSVTLIKSSVTLNGASLLLKCLGAVIHDTLCKTKKQIKPCLLLKMHCKDIVWILWHDIKWVLLPFLMERALVIFKGSPLVLIVAAGGKSHLIMQKIKIKIMQNTSFNLCCILDLLWKCEKTIHCKYSKVLH